jgi:two-component system, OmpR family, response regulator
MNAPLKVLCVDDHADTADSTAQMLRLAGLEARSCYDANTALGVAEQFGPDVYVLDLTMPGMDGVQLGMHLRDWVDNKPVRIIALTGCRDYDARYLARNAGFDGHLVKPADPKHLLAAIHGEPAAV